jgi:hypothetical protein
MNTKTEAYALFLADKNIRYIQHEISNNDGVSLDVDSLHGRMNKFIRRVSDNFNSHMDKWEIVRNMNLMFIKTIDPVPNTEDHHDFLMHEFRSYQMPFH